MPASLLLAQSGVIQGVVVDPSGQAVPRARVEIVPVPRRPLSSAALYRNADTLGRFSFNPVLWGTYRIYAIAPVRRNNYETWDFARAEPGPSVTLTPDTPEAQVTVNTGPPLGRLAPFSAIDSSTGTLMRIKDPFSGDEVSRVSITLMSPKGGIVLTEAMVSTTGIWIEILLPANVPITMKVQAPGFADWYYPGTADKSSARPITVESGGLFELGTIALTPKVQ